MSRSPTFFLSFLAFLEKEEEKQLSNGTATAQMKGEQLSQRSFSSLRCISLVYKQPDRWALDRAMIMSRGVNSDEISRETHRSNNSVLTTLCQLQPASCWSVYYYCSECVSVCEREAYRPLLSLLNGSENPVLEVVKLQRLPPPCNSCLISFEQVSDSFAAIK